MSAILNDRKIEETCAKYMEDFSKRIDLVEQNLSTKANSKDVKNLKDKVDSIENKILEISANKPGPDITAEDGMRALEEREKCRKNVIMY